MSGSRPSTESEWLVTLHSLLGVPPTAGNEVQLLRNGDEIFPVMLEAIDGATATVDLVTFVYWSGDIAERFARSLGDAGRRGLRVRVLLDAVGARKIDADLVDVMESAGVEVRWFRPVVDGTPEIGSINHRTHRKILVCDGRIGFTGGVGIADEWTGDARDETEWRDTHVAVEGPAVAGLAAAFVDNWADTDEDFQAAAESPVLLDPVGSTDCFVLRGAAETGASDLRRLLLALIQLASKEIRITSAYFNPDDHLVAELRRATERGVEVQLLLPGQHADKRFVQLNGEGDYQSLLDGGVKICTYERSMMHAKIVTIDGIIASVGSANLNIRSMQHDEECNLVAVDRGVVAELDRHFDDDLRHTVSLDPQRWADRGLFQRMGEMVAGVVDRWF